jgi:lysophospholipase L1-like esterase
VAAIGGGAVMRRIGVRFLALGDSYTIGEGVAERERWPVQLADRLRRDQRIDPPEILARTGWTTDELAAAMDRHTFQPPYALVTLLIGVNDQYRGRELQNYRDLFRRLLSRAIELSGARPQRVIVVSIPDWGVTGFGRASGRDVAQIAREIDLYNAANAEISHSLQVQYVDVTALSREAADAADMLVADRLHPSAAMYRRWAQAIAPVAEQGLSSH